MAFSLPLYQMRGYGKLTQNAGTVITRLIEPVKNAFTRLTSFVYTNLATAHTLTVMRPLNKTTLSAAAAGGQADITITADPGNYPASSRVADNVIAANDFVVLEAADGTFILDTVSVVAGLVITLTNNLPTGGCKSGAVLWFFGVIADTNPADSLAHPQFTLTASVVTRLGSDPGDSIAGFIGTIPNPNTDFTLNGKYEPIILHSGNATNAGIMEKATAIYSSK